MSVSLSANLFSNSNEEGMIYGLPSKISFSLSLLGLRAPNWKTGRARHCSPVESGYSVADTEFNLLLRPATQPAKPRDYHFIDEKECSLSFKT